MSKRVLSDVHPGQMWRDRDPRMMSGGRVVRVIEADKHGFVVYRVWPFGDGARKYSSRYERFQRAFDLAADLPEDGR